MHHCMAVGVVLDWPSWEVDCHICERLGVVLSCSAAGGVTRLAVAIRRVTCRAVSVV